MKEENKTCGLRPEERGVAPTEKQEGGRPGNYGPEDGEELLDAARVLLGQWVEMRPEHRGLVLAAADMDIVFGEDGLDAELTKVNAGTVAIIGIGSAANLAAIRTIEGSEPLQLAREYFKQS